MSNEMICRNRRSNPQSTNLLLNSKVSVSKVLDVIYYCAFEKHRGPTPRRQHVTPSQTTHCHYQTARVFLSLSLQGWMSVHNESARFHNPYTLTDFCHSQWQLITIHRQFCCRDFGLGDLQILLSRFPRA